MRNTLITIILSFGSCYAQTSVINSVGRPLSSILNSLPRVTFTSVHLTPQFDPANGDYWQSMAVLAIFGAICTILSVIFSLVVPMITGCGLLGGNEPMEGFHRGIPRKRPYPSSHRTILVALFIIAAMVVSTIVAFGYMANNVMNSNFEAARVSIRDASNRLYNSSVQMYTEFQYLQQLQPSRPNLDVIVNVLSTVVESQQALHNNTYIRDVGRINKVRYYLLCFVYAITLLPPILGLIGGIFVEKDCAQYSRSIAWYMLIIAWLAFTVHLPLTAMAGDACNEMSNYMSMGNSTANTTIPTSSNGGIIASCK